MFKPTGTCISQNSSRHVYGFFVVGGIKDDICFLFEIREWCLTLILMMFNFDTDESYFNHTKTWHSIGLTCFMASESFYGKYVWNTKVFDTRHPYKEMESIWEFHTLHHTYFVGIKGKMVLFWIYLKIRYYVRRLQECCCVGTQLCASVIFYLLLWFVCEIKHFLIQQVEFKFDQTMGQYHPVLLENCK